MRMTSDTALPSSARPQAAATPAPRTRLRLPARAAHAVHASAPVACPAPQGSAPPLPSEQLLQGRKAIEISHNGSVYRLQATRLGKLILTK
ncbi:MAG: hemin uptake protein HemP [Pseudomonadota bacterium]|nr:hemin uptake protein HemP [Pseudomonadota bacterium]